MDIRRFDLDAQGLARVLGELEAKILEVVWSRGRVTVKDVTDALGPQTNVKTVMTVMNRMVEKECLRRQRSGRAFYYESATDREIFMAQVARRVMAGLMTDFRTPTLAHLIDDADPEQLAELEALIRSRRGD
ncbi:MAG: BlaI/MecI/CopY family transcriptional regulator [Chloroflexota bacterium]|nr:BlaI/MecI/CopY family transcriptional regulator [Chloroflexota bacterium]